MSDSDISFETDDEGLSDVVHRNIESLLPSRWSDINSDDIEISARKIYSYVASNGLLTTLEQRPSNRHSTEPLEENEMRGNAVKGKYQDENPTAFIQKNVTNMDMKELLAVREDLMTESLNHREHLKRFVKENFQSCISNMDTIREVSTRLQAASFEGGVGAHGATPVKVSEELRNTDAVAQNSFSGLIKRFRLSQNLDNVLQLLGKYDSLVILPSMVRSSVDARDFEAVVTLYQRAMSLVQKESFNTGEVQTIWKRLQSEVFKAMESAVRILEVTLNSSTVAIGDSLEAACYLEKLKSMGVPSASGKKGLDTFFEFQVSKVIDNMKKTREYARSLDQSQKKERIEGQSQLSTYQLNHSPRESPKSHDRLCIQTLTTDFYEWCYELWDLLKTSGSSHGSIIKFEEDSEAAKKRVIARAFSAYSGLIESCIAGICSSPSGMKEYEEIIQFLIETCLESDDDMLDFMIPLCKDLVVHSCQQMIQGLESYVGLNAQNILVVEGNCLNGFLPRDNTMSLHQAIEESLFCISKISKHASRIKVRVPVASYPVNTILKLASEMSSSSISKLASRNPVLSIEGEELDEHVLLLAWNTLERMKTSVLPQVATKWSFLLNSGGTTPKDNAQAFKWCCHQIEESQEYLIRSWVEIKLEKLEPVMETLLTLEEAERTQHHKQTLMELCMAKPCIWEILTSLQSCDANIQQEIPILREEVTGEMYLAVVEGMQNLVLSDHFNKSDLQSKAQLWLDVSLFHSWLLNLERNEKRSDMESRELAQTILSRLEENVRSHIQKVPGNPSLAEVKTWIATICSQHFSNPVDI